MLLEILRKALHATLLSRRITPDASVLQDYYRITAAMGLLFGLFAMAISVLIVEPGPLRLADAAAMQDVAMPMSLFFGVAALALIALAVLLRLSVPVVRKFGRVATSQPTFTVQGDNYVQ